MTDTPPDGPQGPSDDETPPAAESPEQIAADLFRRLDILDDRLQRSQRQMITLLDQKLSGAGPLGGPQEPGDPFPADPRGSRGAAPGDGPASVPGDVVAPELWATATEPALAPEPDQVVAAPAETDPARPAPASAAPTEIASAQTAPTQAAPAPTPPTEAAPAPGAPIRTTPGRPAWLSNGLTVAITAIVVVAALFLVGLL